MLEIQDTRESEFPVLVMHSWCPFTSPATSLWQQAAEATGHTLRVAYADTPEGARVIKSLDVRGVPCVATGAGRLHYGMASSDEAATFLND